VEQKDYLSNSQISTYHSCPHKYYLSYIKDLPYYSSNIFSIFGTAMHETLQTYLKTMFNETIKKADSLPLEKMLQDEMIKAFKEAKANGEKDICTLDEIKEAYLDGIEIINYFLKKRRKYFTTKQYELLAIEEELIVPITEHIKFKGYLDVVLKDRQTGHIKIIDLKTSYNGWKDKKKKKVATRQQLIFYKDFYSKKFNVPLENIDIEYLILKRKVYAESDWPIPRMQTFTPPSSKRTIEQYEKLITEMIDDVFDESGQRIDKEYPTRKSAENCKYCPYKKTKDCPEW